MMEIVYDYATAGLVMITGLIILMALFYALIVAAFIGDSAWQTMKRTFGGHNARKKS